MTEWIVALLLVLCFVILVRLFSLIERNRELVAIAWRSVDVLRNKDLSDSEKEAAVQQSAQRLFSAFGLVALFGSLLFLLPVALLWLFDQLGWVSFDLVLQTAASPTFVVSSGIAATTYFWWSQKRTPVSHTYSLLDRCLHRLAFRTRTAQVALADLENRYWEREITGCRCEPPVFITALPRSGTTLLLECLASLEEFASHTYRDMPFVLTPLLWSRLSSIFQRRVEVKERLHGDGIQIHLDSPEALEELVWLTFWPEHYKGDRIVPWQEEDRGEFDEFFRSHLTKISLLRRGSAGGRVRYVSKNNVNIARIEILKSMFPDSAILILFREPLQQAASLRQQHLNFLRLQGEDPFVSDYMKSIGHLDFGKNLCPIDFKRWLDRPSSQDTHSLIFWIEYWIACYGYLIEYQRE